MWHYESMTNAMFYEEQCANFCKILIDYKNSIDFFYTKICIKRAKQIMERFKLLVYWMYWVCAFINLIHTVHMFNISLHSWPIHDVFMTYSWYKMVTVTISFYSKLCFTLHFPLSLSPSSFFGLSSACLVLLVLHSSDNNTLNYIQVGHCIRIFYWKIKYKYI